MKAQFYNVYIRAIAACSGKTLHNVATTCQSFLDEKHAKRLVKTLGFENVREVLDAGANIIVAGSAVFRGDAGENTAKFMEILKSYE